MARAGDRQQAATAWREGSAILSEMGDSDELTRKRQEMLEACKQAGVESLDNPAASDVTVRRTGAD